MSQTTSSATHDIVVAGGGPMPLRRYLEEGAAIILDELSGLAKPLQGEQHLA